MDHESMNLWDDQTVVKAFAEAAIVRFRQRRPSVEDASAHPSEGVRA